jgi:hypothetical protein
MREPWRTLFLIAMIVVALTMTKCEADAMQPVPLNPTVYPQIELLGELAEGDVLIYRIVDKVEGLTVICYPMVGELHGKTVSNFCIYKPSIKWRGK